MPAQRETCEGKQAGRCGCSWAGVGAGARNRASVLSTDVSMLLGEGGWVGRCEADARWAGAG